MMIVIIKGTRESRRFIMKKILILIVSITLASYLFAENTLGKLKQTLNTNNYVLSWYRVKSVIP